MATLSTLTNNDVTEAIDYAASGHARVTVTVHHQNRWITFQSKVLAAQAGFIWVTFPQIDESKVTYEFSQGERVGMTFRRAHHRFVFAANIAGTEEYEDDSGQSAQALRLGIPDEIQLTERRAQPRVELPVSAMVRASIWLGGWQAQPAEPTVAIPVWSGRVIDLSAGGCYVRTNREVSRYIDVGDVVGIRLTFGADDNPEEVLLDAQYRRSDPDGTMSLVGFQFVDIDETEQSREAHERIRAKLREF